MTHPYFTSPKYFAHLDALAAASPPVVTLSPNGVVVRVSYSPNTWSRADAWAHLERHPPACALRVPDVNLWRKEHYTGDGWTWSCRTESK